MQKEMTTIEAFWKVLNSPTGDESEKREVKIKSPSFSLPRFEFPKFASGGIATS
jgi:hypothetical protein